MGVLIKDAKKHIIAARGYVELQKVPSKKYNNL